jgi:hypothetical protein
MCDHELRKPGSTAARRLDVPYGVSTTSYTRPLTMELSQPSQ